MESEEERERKIRGGEEKKAKIEKIIKERKKVLFINLMPPKPRQTKSELKPVSCGLNAYATEFNFPELYAVGEDNQTSGDCVCHLLIPVSIIA